MSEKTMQSRMRGLWIGEENITLPPPFFLSQVSSFTILRRDLFIPLHVQLTLDEIIVTDMYVVPMYIRLLITYRATRDFD